MGRGEEQKEENGISARFSHLDKVGLRKHGFMPVIQDKHDFISSLLPSHRKKSELLRHFGGKQEQKLQWERLNSRK